jgi:hypothetical protein
MVMWDLRAMKPQKVMNVPGSPLEIRWSLKAGDNWALTATALTSQLVLVKQDAAGEWQAKAVAAVGDPAQIPLPVDISISADAKGLWVNTFMDGKALTEQFALDFHALQLGRAHHMKFSAKPAPGPARDPGRGVAIAQR